MKNLASPSFFRTFDLLLSAGNPVAKLTLWSYDGVEWVRDRYSINSSSHSFVIEIVTLARPGRRGWSLMVAKEHWWAGQRSDPVRSVHWARPISGNRKDIIEWFRKHEVALDRDAQQLGHGKLRSA